MVLCVVQGEGACHLKNFREITYRSSGLVFMSQNVTVSLEMDSFLKRSWYFFRYLFSSLDFPGFSCEYWFLVTLSPINIPLK